MAVTEAPTHADLGELKREMRSGISGLSTKLVEIEDTMVDRFDKVDERLDKVDERLDGLERDLGAIRRHLGVPDDD